MLQQKNYATKSGFHAVMHPLACTSVPHQCLLLLLQILSDTYQACMKRYIIRRAFVSWISVYY